MELSLRVESDAASEDAALLQKFIAKQNLDGIELLELQRAPHQPGEMGVGKFIGNLLINISDNLNVVKTVLTELNLFAVKYDRRIHLHPNIIIPTNKLTGEQIERIALEALRQGKE